MVLNLQHADFVDLIQDEAGYAIRDIELFWLGKEYECIGSLYLRPDGMRTLYSRLCNSENHLIPMDVSLFHLMLFYTFGAVGYQLDHERFGALCIRAQKNHLKSPYGNLWELGWNIYVSDDLTRSMHVVLKPTYLIETDARRITQDFASPDTNIGRSGGLSSERGYQ